MFFDLRFSILLFTTIRFLQLINEWEFSEMFGQPYIYCGMRSIFFLISFLKFCMHLLASINELRIIVVVSIFGK